MVGPKRKKESNSRIERGPKVQRQRRGKGPKYLGTNQPADGVKGLVEESLRFQ